MCPLPCCQRSYKSLDPYIIKVFLTVYFRRGNTFPYFAFVIRLNHRRRTCFSPSPTPCPGFLKTDTCRTIRPGIWRNPCPKQIAPSVSGSLSFRKDALSARLADSPSADKSGYSEELDSGCSGAGETKESSLRDRGPTPASRAPWMSGSVPADSAAFFSCPAVS